MNHLFRRSAVPAAGCLLSSSIYQNHSKQQNRQYHSFARCDANVDGATNIVPKIQKVEENQLLKDVPTTITPSVETVIVTQNQPVEEKPKVVTEEKVEDGKSTKADNKPQEEEEEEGPMYHDLFPERQLCKPKIEYPLWDEDWDGRKMESTGDKDKDRRAKRYVRKNGVTKHIILIRHGQYVEKYEEDEKRILTSLGRKQAELTGQRLAKMLQGFDEKFGPCNIKTIRVSGMARAQETADIIAQNIPGAVHRSDPDPNLNEGRPCHHIPGGKASQRAVKQTDDSHDRIEKAFKTYFHRADPPLSEEEKEKEANKAVVVTSSSNGKVVEEDDEDEDESMELKPHPQHEFEIIVCHANVIRYFLCRALQIPPEAWLRLCTFNCSLTYLTVRPTGTVSCRMLGDIGHLGYEHSTFSMHHGFNW